MFAGIKGRLHQASQSREAAPAPPQLYHGINKEPEMTTISLGDVSSHPIDYDRSVSVPAKQPLLPDRDPQYQGHDGFETSAPERPWKPLMLRRWVLLVFAVLFFLLIASLEIILKVTTDRHGFGPVESNLYYVWTYGPVVVFTIVAAFWTQVDYRTRQMQPWEELASRTGKKAAETLLLDYVSCNPIVSFPRTIMHRHWPVAMVLLGSFLIKGLIVVSTSLFVLNPVVRPRNVAMGMTERFEFSTFNATDVDDTAGLMYAGNLFNEIDYLPGTNGEYAAALFNSSQLINGTQSMTASSKTFTADLSCEAATIDPIVKTGCESERSSCLSLHPTMNIHNENCRMSDWPPNEAASNSSSSILNWDDGRGQRYMYGGVYASTCEGEGNISDRQRLVILTLYNDFEVVSNDWTSVTFKNITAMFCKPSCQLQQSLVTVDQLGAIERIEPGPALEQPTALDPFAVAEAVMTTLSQTDWIDFVVKIAKEYKIDQKRFYSIDNPMFLYLIFRAIPSRNVADLSNAEVLGPAAQKVFRSVAAQVAKRYFLVANTPTAAEQITGELVHSQQRLFARTLTLRVMESFLCLLIIVCLYLGSRPSRHTTPQDPASIARIGAMISQSRTFSQTMSHAGFLSLNNLKSLLPGRYHTQYYKDTYATNSRMSRFVIDVHDTGSQDVLPADGKYWRPMSMTWFPRVSLLVVPLMIIIVLEVTYRKSQRDDGLLVVASNKVTDYGSHFIPALVMVLTKFMFSAADFDLRIIDPYIQLKRGYASAKSSVLNKTIYTWKADAFWNAFMHKRIAVASSTLSVVIASFLTVAASGLFTTTPISHQYETKVMRMDSFYDPSTMHSNLNSTLNYTTSFVARLVVYDRMTSPPWTSGSYVLPTLSLLNDTFDNENKSSPASIDISVPVRRGTLTCELIPRSDVELNYTDWDEHYKESYNTGNGMTVRWPMLDDHACTYSMDGNTTYKLVNSIFDGPFGLWTNFNANLAIGGKNSNASTSACPTSYGIYGTWAGRRAKELNVVLCWSSVQELNASAHYTMPGWKLQSLTPDQRTVANFSDGLYTQLDLATSVFMSVENNISDYLDSTFTGFLRNSTSNSLDMDLLASHNFDKLYERMKGRYSRATAQFINREGRYTNLTSSRITMPATATDFSTSRLKQNVISTRILQGLLIAMLLCALVALLTSNPKNVLPKNPCSIAAQASLVAGSSMLAGFPAEAQWMDDRDFAELCKRKKYTMGWSGEGYDQGRFGVEVDVSPRERGGKRWWTWT